MDKIHFENQKYLKEYITPMIEKKDFSFLVEISNGFEKKERFTRAAFLYLSNTLLNSHIDKIYEANIIDLIQCDKVYANNAREEKEVYFKKLNLISKIRNPEIKKDIFFKLAEKIISNKDIEGIMGKLQTEKYISDTWDKLNLDKELIKPILKNYFNQPDIISNESSQLYITNINLDVLGLKLKSEKSYAHSQVNSFLKTYDIKALEHKSLFNIIRGENLSIFFQNSFDNELFNKFLNASIEEGCQKQKPSLRINSATFDKTLQYEVLNMKISESDNLVKRNKI